MASACRRCLPTAAACGKAFLVPAAGQYCDMLPLGHIGIRSIEHGKGDRWTRLSREEQRTMMTLFCIFRSPLMMGGELRDNDEWTLSLLTNPDVLRLLHHSDGAHELSRGASSILWASRDEDGSLYLAFSTRGRMRLIWNARCHPWACLLSPRSRYEICGSAKTSEL